MQDTYRPFPSVGEVLTYKEASYEYRKFEEYLLRRAYGPVFLPMASMWELQSELFGYASKYGFDESSSVLSALRKLMRDFSTERGYVETGINGERFHNRGCYEWQVHFDETNYFVVNVDGNRLKFLFDIVVSELLKRASTFDVYRDLYTPGGGIDFLNKPRLA